MHNSHDTLINFNSKNMKSKYDFEEIIYISGSIVCLIGMVFLVGFILKAVAHLI